MENEMAATPRVANNSNEAPPLEQGIQLEPGSQERFPEELHSRLLAHARSCSRAWKLEGKSAENGFLLAELKKTVELLPGLRNDRTEGGLPLALRRTLLTSRLLLQATAFDVRDRFARKHLCRR